MYRVIKKLLWFLLWLMILILFLNYVDVHSAHAEIVKPKSLGGISKAIDDFYDSGNEFYEEEDLKLLAEVMYHENGSNSDKCILYTGSVVLNRVTSKEFPNSIHDVLYQRGQYSTTPMFFSKKIPNHIYDLAKELLIFGSQLPQGYVFQAMFPQTKDYIKVETEYFCRK